MNEKKSKFHDTVNMNRGFQNQSSKTSLSEGVIFSNGILDGRR